MRNRNCHTIQYTIVYANLKIAVGLRFKVLCRLLCSGNAVFIFIFGGKPCQYWYFAICLQLNINPSHPLPYYMKLEKTLMFIDVSLSFVGKRYGVSLNLISLKVLSVLSHRHFASVKTISSLLCITEAAVYFHVSKLLTDGLIRKDGRNLYLSSIGRSFLSDIRTYIRNKR